MVTGVAAEVCDACGDVVVDAETAKQTHQLVKDARYLWRRFPDRLHVDTSDPPAEEAHVRRTCILTRMYGSPITALQFTSRLQPGRAPRAAGLLVPDITGLSCRRAGERPRGPPLGCQSSRLPGSGGLITSDTVAVSCLIIGGSNLGLRGGSDRESASFFLRTAFLFAVSRALLGIQVYLYLERGTALLGPEKLGFSLPCPDVDVGTARVTVVANLGDRLPSLDRLALLHPDLSGVRVRDGDAVLLVFEDNQAGTGISVHRARLVGGVGAHDFGHNAIERREDAALPSVPVLIVLPPGARLVGPGMPSSPTFVTEKSRASWSTIRS